MNWREAKVERFTLRETWRLPFHVNAMLNISIVYNSSVVQNIWILSQPIGYVKHEIEICSI